MKKHTKIVLALIAFVILVGAIFLFFNTSKKEDQKGITLLKQLAIDSGLDKDKLELCLSSSKYSNKFKTDPAEAKKVIEELKIEKFGTPALFINGMPSIGAQPYSEVKPIIEEELAGTTSTNTIHANLTVGDAPILGDNNAKVTVIIFSDPSCPYCAAAAGKNQQVINYLKQMSPNWEPSIPNIIKDYVNTGKAKITFKYYPSHGLGKDAMNIMWCANEQGKFWEIHDVMFDNQDKMNN